MTILRTNTIAGIGETFGPLFDGDFEFNSQNYVILPKGTASQSGVLRDITDVVGAGRTFYDNLVLAMPFNAATGLTDVSSRNRNPAAYGNVSISSTISKYYGSSAKFDGNGDYLSIDVGISTSTSDFVLGPSGSDFTIEMYLYATSSANGGIISTYSNWNTSAGYLNRWALIFSENNIQWYNSAGGIGIGESAILNQWVHYAICRSGSTITMYRNGISIGTQTTNQNYTSIDPLVTGYINGWGYYQGYIQDLRVYKGIAKYTANFTPPDRIAEVGVGFKSGALRYNTDSSKVELYDGSQWTEVQSSRPDLNGGARGLIMGGETPGPTNVTTISYITISSTGNAIVFGDLTLARRGFNNSALASSTRGIIAGGFVTPTPTLTASNIIDYVTISSTGDAIDFGDKTLPGYYWAAVSNSTRGIWGGGYAPMTPTTVNTLEYITIASTGDAKDFGDLTRFSRSLGTVNSPTRGVFAGGSGPIVNTIDFVTISTLGDARDFGDLSIATALTSGTCNATRGVFAGGATPSNIKVINYITISTLGNAVRFGDLTQETFYSSSMSSSTRGVYAQASHSYQNTIEYITISTQGNGVDFGDNTELSVSGSGCSNAHGGL